MSTTARIILHFTSFLLFVHHSFPHLLGSHLSLYFVFTLFQPKESDNALFLPEYYYGFTAFRSKTRDLLYLGCDNKKSATLVKMKDVKYPNPQALFTVNKV